jgi:PadR family transcriptional regulator PadR
MAPVEPRITIPTQLVLRALLDDVTREMYGVEISDLAGLRSGTVHPILARLEGMGWITSKWEDIDARVMGRPARRYYRLTADGAVSARSYLARAHGANAPLRSLRPLTDRP